MQQITVARYIDVCPPLIAIAATGPALSSIGAAILSLIRSLNRAFFSPIDNLSRSCSARRVNEFRGIYEVNLHKEDERASPAA